jgi:hypothetical protein
MRCQLCLYESDHVESFRKHFSRATCRTARTVRFSCRHCDFVGGSVKQVLDDHGCLMSKKNGGGGGLLTTAAVTQWHVMKKQLKEARRYIPQLQLSEVNLNNQHQLTTLPTALLLDLHEAKKWLNPLHMGLPPLKLETIALTNKSSVARRFFDFRLNGGQIDARHFFKLLLAKAEASYWPFCRGLVDVDDIFGADPPWCGKSADDRHYYLRFTRQPLSSAVYEKSYGDWHWVRTSPEDFSRFVHDEWTSVHYRNVIRVLKDSPFLGSETWTDLESESRRVAEKLNVLVPTLAEFVTFWGDEKAVRRRVEPLSLVETPEVYECVKLSSTFDETVRSVVPKKHQRKWQPVVHFLFPN